MQDIYDHAVGKAFIGTLDAPKAFYGKRVAETSRSSQIVIPLDYLTNP